jgi:alkylated DNA repair dioxygenase AlkB
VRLPGALADDECRALQDIAPATWRELEPRVGYVEQAGEYAQLALVDSSLAVQEVAAAITERVATARRDIDPAILVFNEATWQRHAEGVGRISAHRDQSFYVGVIAILTLLGSAPFAILGGREPRVVIEEWNTAPGDVVLLRGTGWGDPDARCPWHDVGRPTTSQRITLTLRHNSRGPGNWD